MARKNRQKPEEKPMDFLDTFNQPEPEQVPEEIKEAPEVEIKEEPNKVTSYKVKVTHPSLRMRRAPNTQAEVYDLITDQGIYTIVDEVNGWGQLENGCWIMLSYTEIV